MEEKITYHCVKETTGGGSSAGGGSTDGSSGEQDIETEVFEGAFSNSETNQNIEISFST